jgi:hypothetical protein
MWKRKATHPKWDAAVWVLLGADVDIFEMSII